MTVDEPWHQSENCIVDGEKSHSPPPVSRDGLSSLAKMASFTPVSKHLSIVDTATLKNMHLTL